MTEKRPYRMRKRAESQDETRRRIVEATMHLHEEIGPRATTISAIAERAGVQRLTVYRHFPDETTVFQACTSHWLSLNPPPGPHLWDGVAEKWERLRAAFSAFYAYYGATQRMLAASHRDVADVPALQAPMAELTGYIDSIGSGLADQCAPPHGDAQRFRATLQHALTFPAWADLDARGLGNDAKVDLVELWLRGVETRTADAMT